MSIITQRAELELLGIAHAVEALEQVALFKDRAEAVDSYRTNLYDTLIEMGLGNNADAVHVAEDAFERQLALAGINSSCCEGAPL